MEIFSELAQSVVSIKQYSMYIGKSMRIVGTDEHSLNIKIFMNPPTREPMNPQSWMIKNNLSVEKRLTRLACRRNKIILGTQEPQQV
jgi:hypothetical protein